MLSDYKTYLCAIGVGLASVAHAIGYLPEPAFTMIVGLLGGGGLASLRHGISKTAIKTEEQCDEVKAKVQEVKSVVVARKL